MLYGHFLWRVSFGGYCVFLREYDDLKGPKSDFKYMTIKGNEFENKKGTQ